MRRPGECRWQPRKMDFETVRALREDVITGQTRRVALPINPLVLRRYFDVGNRSPTPLERRCEELSDLHTFRRAGFENVRAAEAERFARSYRFCSRHETQLSFKKKTHAESDAIGNTVLISLEECDEYNASAAVCLK